MPMRLVFAGTPSVAVPTLRALLDSSHEVAAVITRPDARSGRGRRAEAAPFSPVKQVALEAGVEVLQPGRMSDPDVLIRLAQIAPDCCPVVAYGGLLPPAALAIPPRRWLNLHFSLLPAWRGAAPVQHAIISGDDVTGASVFVVEAGLDTGPVLSQVTESIGPQDTAGDLLTRLSHVGAGLFATTVDAWAAGRLDPAPQPAHGVTAAPKLTTQDARVRFEHPAMAIDRLVRGCTPAPGAWAMWRGERIKLGPVRLVGPLHLGGPSHLGGPAGALPPGQVLVGDSEVFVGTATDAIRLGQVQPAGKRPMTAIDWARGVRFRQDEAFDPPDPNQPPGDG